MTGVQTCALPISAGGTQPSAGFPRLGLSHPRPVAGHGIFSLYHSEWMPRAELEPPRVNKAVEHLPALRTKMSAIIDTG